MIGATTMNTNELITWEDTTHLLYQLTKKKHNRTIILHQVTHVAMGTAGLSVTQVFPSLHVYKKAFARRLFTHQAKPSIGARDPCYHEFSRPRMLPAGAGPETVGRWSTG